MKRRISAFIISLLMVITILPAQVFASDTVASGVCGDDLTWILDDAGVLAISGIGSMQSYDYGDFIYEGEKYSVNTPWHEYTEFISRVIINDGVLTIGSHAFYGCKNLTSIVIPNSVTCIEQAAFRECLSLKAVVLPEGIESISSCTFEGCICLTSIVIPENVTEIGGCAFLNCISLKTIRLPSGITRINNNTFEGCTGLINIEIPSGVIRIDTSAFFGCSALNSVFIPDTVTNIYSSVFSGCWALSDIYYGGTEEQWNSIQINNYNDLILTANIHYNCTGIPTTDEENVFRYPSTITGSVESYPFEYEDRWFSYDSYDYYNASNQTISTDQGEMLYDMLKTSLKMSMAAFALDGDPCYNDNIKDFYEKCGFTDYYASYPYPEENTVGYAFAHREIETDNGESFTVIAVAIRGHGYMTEWAGNFYVGSDTIHSGFNVAAARVILALREYITEYDSNLSDRIKVWVTGYSRAAAIANLVGKHLDDGAVDRVDSKDVYAFCFECPQTTTDSSMASNYKYVNIISIVNPLDVVTKVPLSSGWNYQRFGMTYYLPSRAFNSNYSDLHASMITKYYDIGSYYDQTVEDLYKYTWEISDEFVTLENFMTILSVLIPSTEKYITDYQDRMMYTIGQYESGNDFAVSFYDCLIDITAMLSPVLLYQWTMNRMVDLFQPYRLYYDHEQLLPIGTTKVSIGALAHYPELCLAWLESLDGDWSWGQYNCSYRRVFVNCPVNVSVYDEKGALVGQIINDEPVEIENGIITYCDYNGQKVLILPSDAEYSVQIEATEDGEMTYTVSECDYSTGATTKVISYQEVEITQGDTLYGVIEDLDTIDEAEYGLQKDDTSLDPDVNVSGITVPEYTVTINVDGTGTVLGGGRYITGEYTRMLVESENESFIGWYMNGELLSDEPDYRMLVTEDMDITAKFGASFVYGDANGDGKVNSRDVILLKQYLANYDDETGTSTVEIGPGADANGDGKINSRDVILLKQYLANYDDDTGTSTVQLGPSTVTYTVSVDYPDGTDDETYCVESGKNVTLTSKHIPGMAFVCWQDNDENVLSTESTYVFKVTGNVTVVAVYEESPDVPPEARIVNAWASSVSGNCDINILAEYAVSEGYTVLEAGVIYSTTAEGDDLIMSGSDVSFSSAGLTNSDNRAEITITAKDATASVNIKAFVIVMNDLNGNVSTYYSEQLTTSYMALVGIDQQEDDF